MRKSNLILTEEEKDQMTAMKSVMEILMMATRNAEVPILSVLFNTKSDHKLALNLVVDLRPTWGHNDTPFGRPTISLSKFGSK
jgi:hypothetical protein